MKKRRGLDGKIGCEMRCAKDFKKTVRAGLSRQCERFILSINVKAVSNILHLERFQLFSFLTLSRNKLRIVALWSDVQVVV